MSLTNLPANLPVPVDDGQCDHLEGMRIPDDLYLCNRQGESVNLWHMCKDANVVIYVYPMTGHPDRDLPTGWEQIPGARGCTPQSCSYRDKVSEFSDAGFTVYGCSVQDFSEQNEARGRLHLPFDLLSDAAYALKDKLKLPVFDVGGRKFFRRVTLIIVNGVIVKCFYPVFPPDKDVLHVLDWISENMQ